MSKILLVSLGSIGLRHLRNTRQLLPDAEIAVYRLHSSDDQVVPEGANCLFFDLGSALAFQPDAVIISSPASSHVDNATDFIKNGAHVFIEKPLAVNYGELGELLEVSRDSDVFAMVGYVLRFQPILAYLKQQIEDGVVGKVRSARVEVGQYLPDWRPGSDYRKGVSAQKALGGGALLELSHEIDYATWLFGMPDKLICSSGKLSDLDIDVEDSACLMMEYGRDVMAKRVVVQVDFLQRVANMSVQVVGSEGTLFADLIQESAYITSPEQAEPVTLDVPKMEMGNEMYLRQFDYFFTRSFPNYKPLYEGTSNNAEYVTLQRAADVLKLVDLAKQSNEQGIRLNFESSEI